MLERAIYFFWFCSGGDGGIQKDKELNMGFTAPLCLACTQRRHRTYTRFCVVLTWNGGDSLGGWDMSMTPSSSMVSHETTRQPFHYKLTGGKSECQVVWKSMCPVANSEVWEEYTWCFQTATVCMPFLFTVKSNQMCDSIIQTHKNGKQSKEGSYLFTGEKIWESVVQTGEGAWLIYFPLLCIRDIHQLLH